MTLHTVPVNDLIEHSTDGTPCVCDPIEITYDNGAKQIIHNSADGREHYEPDHDGFNCPVCNPWLELRQNVAKLKAQVLSWLRNP